MQLAGPKGSETIRAMSTTARATVDPAVTVIEKVSALNRLLFVDMGFHADDSLNSADSLLPSQVIKKRSGYCLGLATVYLALAKELGMPVWGVATPSHLFIRYDDGHEKVNIELLSAGAIFDDSWYIRQYHIPPSAVESGVFMKSLTEREVLAYVYANLGTLYSHLGDFENSKTLYKAALRELPSLPVAHYNLGNDLFAERRYQEAIKSFSQALKLYPTDLWALNNRALAYCKDGRTKRARRDFQMALRLDPTFAVARENLLRMKCGT